MTASSRRRFVALASMAIGLSGSVVPLASKADLVDIVASAKRSVLPVGTFSATDNPRFNFKGTAFVVGDGLTLITNAHVVADLAPVPALATPAPGGSPPAPKATALPGAAGGAPTPTSVSGQLAGPQLAVLLPGTADSARVRLARLEAIDRARDLAVLRIDGPALPALALDSNPAREGQSIALIGFPVGGVLGFAPVTHRGIVAALTTLALPAATSAQLDPRAVARLREGNFEILQLDATAYPGNSGGPVLDASTGRVLGVVNMVLVKDNRESALANPTGISYAIPTRQVQALLSEGRTGR